VSRYRFIHAERATYPITRLCRTLGVARSGYYAWRRRGPSVRQQADHQLSVQIAAVHGASRGTYGAPRVHAALQQRAVRCGRKRVARLMRAGGLTGIRRGRRRPRTTVVDPRQRPAPNLLRRDFTATAPNQLWVGDLTYIPTQDGWLYLAVLLDACSRRVVGWAMADHLRTELAAEALALALGRRRPSASVTHHTDRGSQYTAAAYQQVLAAQGMTVSMSRAGDCYDNALAESFFATLKAELSDRQSWPTRQAARQAIFEWIEVFYNRQRLHSALGYCPPATYEERMVLMMQAA
jgi:putative transposase